MRRSGLLVTGLHGFVGSRFAQMQRNSFCIFDFCRRHHGAYRHHAVHVPGDLFSEYDIDRAISDDSVAAVLHLAAKTHIDACEGDRDKGKTGEAWKLNVDATGRIASSCKKYGKYLLCLSTECVFDGAEGEYTERDTPRPKNWYGETKYAGERAVFDVLPHACIVRAVHCFGHPDRRAFDIFRFFFRILRTNGVVEGVVDQVISFTFVDELVDVLASFLIHRPSGLYHFSGRHALSPFSFAGCIQHSLRRQTGIIRGVSLDSYFGSASRLRLRHATLNAEKIRREFSFAHTDLRDVILAIVRKEEETYP